MEDDRWGSVASERKRKKRDSWLLGCCGWAGLTGLSGPTENSRWFGGKS
jgi:hypothetical protein